ncbi:hypothetical protein GGI05_002999, partial [Coemansia sp. RSA 2603]
EDGSAVVIESALEVERQVLPNHFETAKFYSFTRQFHLYGFRRTTDGRKKKEPCGYCKFQHSQFRRGHPELLQDIARTLFPKNQNNSPDSKVKLESSRGQAVSFKPATTTQMPNSGFKLVHAPTPTLGLVSAISSISIAPNAPTSEVAGGSSSIGMNDKWFQPDISKAMIPAPPMPAAPINFGHGGFSPSATVSDLTTAQTMRSKPAPAITPSASALTPSYFDAQQMDADLQSSNLGPICTALQLINDGMKGLETD